MAEASVFSSPWISAPSYWMVVAARDLNSQAMNALKKRGFKPIVGSADHYGHQVAAPWPHGWKPVAELFNGNDVTDHTRVAVIPGDTLPLVQEIGFHLKPWREIERISQHIWLLDALSQDRLICFMQHAVDRRGKRVGYEAFARVEETDGSVIGGGIIMSAARSLGIEYQLDRIMHKQAIANFVEGDLEGYLFINFLTGFIHRPEIYLEGLSQAVLKHHLMPRTVVLDVPLPDYSKDRDKLRSIAEYCKQRGFAIALDDVISPQGLEPMMKEVAPAFVKLDAKLAHKLDPARLSQLGDIVKIAHDFGAMVLAEGVETEALHDLYMQAGVDLFQGYLFGAPERYLPGHKPSGRRKV